MQSGIQVKKACPRSLSFNYIQRAGEDFINHLWLVIDPAQPLVREPLLISVLIDQRLSHHQQKNENRQEGGRVVLVTDHALRSHPSDSCITVPAVSNALQCDHEHV